VPEYRIDDAGPDHAKTFTAWVVVAGERYGGAEGRSKKEAEQRAAEAAWRTLSEKMAEPTEIPPAEPTAAPDPAAVTGSTAGSEPTDAASLDGHGSADR
jgi:ribonuclease III